MLPRPRKRRSLLARQGLMRRRALRCECLEDRRLLTITVDTLVDEADGSIVDGDVSLRDALAVAPAGETIDFDTSLGGGTIRLTLGELSITKAISVDATALGNGLTIDASGNDPTPGENLGDGSRVFRIDDGDDATDSPVTISGLTLRGGDVDGNGGAIETRENLTVAQSTISGNHSGGQDPDPDGFRGAGGGIWAAANVIVRSSTISRNSAESVYDGYIYGGRGGGVSAGDVTITNSTVSGNSAGDGGGISAGNVAMTNSRISGNSAGYDGSGGGISASNVTVTNGTITGNAAAFGGGISARTATITNSTISGNSAAIYGGGISGGQVTVTSSTISNNVAVVYSRSLLCGCGGGIDSNSVTVTDSTISGNSADGEYGEGGGIRSGTVVVTNSTVSGNSASSGANGRPGYAAGGGISARTATITNSTVSDNSAFGQEVEWGGGISAGNVTVTNSVISDNASGYGGGIQAGTATITNSTISGNSATAYGGGIEGFLTGTIKSSTISGNSAGIDGGGIFVYTDSRYGALLFANTTISGNTAGRDGGGIWAGARSEDNEPISIENSILAGNSSDGTAPDMRPATGTLTVTYSFVGDNTGTGLDEAPAGMPDGNGNLIGDPRGLGVIDPLLGPLTDNGGPTPTLALLPGSPAIDAGDPNFTLPPGVDQRGSPFVRVFAGRVDIGAYETQAHVVGDMNFDGLVDMDDIAGFSLGLAFPLDYEQQYGAPPNANGDTDGDSDFDFDDIPGFVELLGDDPLSGSLAAVASSAGDVQSHDADGVLTTVDGWVTVTQATTDLTLREEPFRLASSFSRADAAERDLDAVTARVPRQERLSGKERVPWKRSRGADRGDGPASMEKNLATVWSEKWDWLERSDWDWS